MFTFFVRNIGKNLKRFSSGSYKALICITSCNDVVLAYTHGNQELVYVDTHFYTLSIIKISYFFLIVLINVCMCFYRDIIILPTLVNLAFLHLKISCWFI